MAQHNINSTNYENLNIEDFIRDVAVHEAKLRNITKELKIGHRQNNSYAATGENNIMCSLAVPMLSLFGGSTVLIIKYHV